MDLKLGIIILVLLVGTGSAREIELTKFAPSPKSDFEFLDFGTVRITKLSRNHFAISGNYALKRNIGPHHIVSFDLRSDNSHQSLSATVFLRSSHAKWCSSLKDSKDGVRVHKNRQNILERPA